MIPSPEQHKAALDAAVESLDPTIWGELRPDAPRQIIEDAIAVYQAHIVGAPVTVTMDEIREVALLADGMVDSGNSIDRDLAEALRRVLGDRIQIAGSEGPK